MSDPLWACRQEDGLYALEAIAFDGVFQFCVRHWISQIEFDQSHNKRGLLESVFEGMMDRFREMAYKNAGGNRFLGWPKQKYDTIQ